MLLLIALTLKGAIAISPTPPPPTDGWIVGESYSQSTKNIDKGEYNNDDSSEEQRKKEIEKILIDDSELVALVELTLRNFTI